MVHSASLKLLDAEDKLMLALNHKSFGNLQSL